MSDVEFCPPLNPDTPGPVVLPAWLITVRNVWPARAGDDALKLKHGLDLLGLIERHFRQIPLINEKLRIFQLENQLREVQRDLVYERELAVQRQKQGATRTLAPALNVRTYQEQLAKQERLRDESRQLELRRLTRWNSMSHDPAFSAEQRVQTLSQEFLRRHDRVVGQVQKQSTPSHGSNPQLLPGAAAAA